MAEGEADIMNPLIAMSGEMPDLGAAIMRGREGFMQQQQYQNALAGQDYMRENAGAVMRGDPNALAGYAQFDPQGAMSMQQGQAGMANDAARLDLARQQTQSGMANDSARLDIARQQAAQATAQHAAQMSAYDRAQASEELDKALAMVTQAQTPEQFDQIMGGFDGGKEYVGRFGDRDMIVAMGLGIKDAMAINAGPEPLTEFQRQSLEMEREKLKVGNRGTFGLNPIEGTDEAGNPIYLQPGSDGSVNQMQFPDGWEPTPGYEKIDVGTEYILRDKKTGEVIGREPKNVAAEAGQKAIGTAQGEAIGGAVTNLPAAEAKAQQAVDLIDSIVTDPKMPGITGMIQGRIPPITQSGTDLTVKIDQLKGKAFLEAFESLKGGGAITEREGQAATEAMARLSRAQSTEAFTEALTELRGIMAAGVERMRARAGQAQPTAPAQPAMPAEPATTGSGVQWRVLD